MQVGFIKRADDEEMKGIDLDPYFCNLIMQRLVTMSMVRVMMSC